MPTDAGRRRVGAPAALTVAALVAVLGAGAVWARGHVTERDRCTATADGQHTDLDAEQAGNAAVISAVAVRRGLPARAASIAIATAMQESKLRNLRYGDRDSVGLFQQRPSQGWGTREQLLDPVYATNAFYDVLVRVEGYQNLPITTAAQRVQRSAFPSAYADHEPQARVAASALTGYSPGALTCTLHEVGAATAAGADPDTPTGRARALASAARTETGRDAQGADGADGTAVRFAIPGDQARRLGWSLAQWAVARASGLDVTSVSTDGLQWRRDAPAARWSPAAGAPPAGTVVIRVATGG